MSTVTEPRGGVEAIDDAVDRREQLQNGLESGPVELVSLPVAMITSLSGILFDLDPDLFNADALAIAGGPVNIEALEAAVKTWLARHPALAGAEVRDSGRGVHVIIRLAEPVEFDSDGERDRWAGIVAVVQAALPIDPDQPALAALTRPIDSINSRTGRRVRQLVRGRAVPVADVIRLSEQMITMPFKTVMGILFGTERIAPCPLCRAEGTSLSAFDHVGRCYGSCGTVTLQQVYDLFFAPTVTEGKGVGDGEG